VTQWSSRRRLKNRRQSRQQNQWSRRPPAPPPAEEQVHIVQAGDNLYRIGLRYGFTIQELVTYNNLANPDRLEIGQQIRIPPEGYTVP
jgi:LysM repeat protein